MYGIAVFGGAGSAGADLTVCAEQADSVNSTSAQAADAAKDNSFIIRSPWVDVEVTWIV
ncbi:MAG: hypothetical protein ACREO8_03905 [Luteimonas sp.]